MSVIYSQVNRNTIEPTAPYTRPLIIPSPPPATMQVKSDETESGYIIINAADFDPAVHTPFGTPSDPAPKKSSAKGAK